jgi:hypothetical protein
VKHLREKDKSKHISKVCLDFLKKAYGGFNVSPTIKKYDVTNRKEVAIETPPDFYIKGRTGTP